MGALRGGHRVLSGRCRHRCQPNRQSAAGAAEMSPDERAVTRADIEAKLREIKGEVDSTTAKAKPYALIAGVAGAVVLVGVAYLLGRRKGKKRTTVVEIR